VELDVYLDFQKWNLAQQSIVCANDNSEKLVYAFRCWCSVNPITCPCNSYAEMD